MDHALKLWRQRHGVTPDELAERIGVHRATIFRIENGDIDPRLKTVRALCAETGLHAGDFVNFQK